MKIEVEKWFNHDQKSLEVPDTGLVVIRGTNGAGKSNFINDAPCEALFGVTARGTKSTPPYSVLTEIGALSVLRKHDGRAAKVTWSVGGVSQGASEGATKANKRIIDFLRLDAEAWQRTHTFSAEKVAKFSGARDSERKSLLEALVGLSDFDDALKQIRDQKKIKNEELRDAQADLAKARALHQAAKEAVEAAEAETTEDLTAEIQRLKDALRTAEEALNAAREATDSTATAADTASVESAKFQSKLNELSRLRHEAKSAVDNVACPTCGRDFEDEVDRDALLDTLKAVTSRLKKATEKNAALTEALKQATAAREQARRDERVTAATAARIKTELADAKQRDRAQKDADRRLKAAKARETEAHMDVIEAGGEVAGVTHEMQVIKGAEDILGLRGARARVLAAALTSLEAGANRSLAVMQSPARLKLSASKTTGTGGVSDTIAVEIDQWGGGDGYAGASGGERKRTDIALLTGLVELYTPPSALGVKLPMIFDDVFDTLDAAGVEEVSRLLVDLARERTVFVITQNEDMADALSVNAALSLRF